MTKLLIITGSTGVGKTKFALSVAKKYNGELISADSRQVYKGMDIVTGKDKEEIYESGIPVWLYDLVNPDESFSVSLWHRAAISAIEDISNRGKIPIVVGGTGLYIRSLTENLTNIHIPPNFSLRKQLSNCSVDDLFSQLTQISPISAKRLNPSDRLNSRRLIRAIEIAKSDPPGQQARFKLQIYTIVITAPLSVLKQRISARVISRLQSGAQKELNFLVNKYPPELSSFTACGYRSLLKSSNPEDWIASEIKYVKAQLAWLKKYSPGNWIDISLPGWELSAQKLINSWYNSPNA